MWSLFLKKYSYDIFMDCSLRNISCKDGFPVAEGQKTVLPWYSSTNVILKLLNNVQIVTKLPWDYPAMEKDDKELSFCFL